MSKKSIPYTMTGESVTVVWKGKPITVKEGAANFPALTKALKAKDWDNVEQNLTVPSSIEGWTEGEFTVVEGALHFCGEELPDDLNERICNMAASGQDPRPLMRFFERLQKNPSWRSVQQLYPFMKHAGIPLTTDGCFLAYKGVDYDYKDKHSRTLDNRPGNVHEMPRNKISDDPKEACHYGLHVGAKNYAQGFGAIVVVCKVAPEDVVCVPHDSSQEKMRVCKYMVISDEPDANHLQGHIVDLPEPKAIKNAYQPTWFEPKDLPVTPPKEKKVKAPKDPFAAFRKLDKAGLLEQPIGELRKYASAGLKISGAYRIPGGKDALVKAIIKVLKKMARSK